MGNAFTVHNIKFCLFERRSDFIFNDFHAGTVAYHIVAVFQSFNPSYIHADSGIKFQRSAAGSCFWISEHNSDFFTDLIDKNSSTFGLGNDTGQLTQSLTHQPGLQANVRITHLAFDLCTRYQSRYGVDNDDIDSAAAY